MTGKLKFLGNRSTYKLKNEKICSQNMGPSTDSLKIMGYLFNFSEKNVNIPFSYTCVSLSIFHLVVTFFPPANIACPSFEQC